MSNKIYLGNRISDLEIGEPALPVSKVVLNVNDRVSYVSGDETGSTIEQYCPWATQAMADSILETMRGFVYKPFSGSNALLDPSVELGDAITVGGHYGVLSQMGRNLDRQSTAVVGAPGTDEIEDEYPYKSQIERKFNRKIAQTWSKIEKTDEEIRLMVATEVDGLTEKYTALAVTLDGVTVTDESGTTRIKGSSVETSTLYVNAANISGTLTANQLNIIGSITWNDLSSGVQNTINNAGLSTSDATTLINSTLVSSPIIAGGKFKDLAQTNWVEMGENTTGTIGYFHHYCSLYSNSSPVMVMGYANQTGNHNWVLAPFFDIKLNYLLTNDTMYAIGNWDFSQANVTGLG